jgi:hypothetical protein
LPALASKQESLAVEYHPGVDELDDLVDHGKAAILNKVFFKIFPSSSEPRSEHHGGAIVPHIQPAGQLHYSIIFNMHFPEH